MSVFQTLGQAWVESFHAGRMGIAMRRLTAGGVLPDFVPAYDPGVIAVVRRCAAEFPELVTADVRAVLAMAPGGVA